LGEEEGLYRSFLPNSLYIEYKRADMCTIGLLFTLTDEVSVTHRYEYDSTSVDDLIGAAVVDGSSPAVDTIGMVGFDDEGGVAVTGMFQSAIARSGVPHAEKKWATFYTGGTFCTGSKNGMPPTFLRVRCLSTFCMGNGP
jgi:hypothetical protein